MSIFGRDSPDLRLSISSIWLHIKLCIQPSRILLPDIQYLSDFLPDIRYPSGFYHISGSIIGSVSGYLSNLISDETLIFDGIYIWSHPYITQFHSNTVKILRYWAGYCSKLGIGNRSGSNQMNVQTSFSPGRITGSLNCTWIFHTKFHRTMVRISLGLFTFVQHKINLTWGKCSTAI